MGDLKPNETSLQHLQECGIIAMATARWQHIDNLFHSALAQPHEERAGFLSEACAGDESLRAEVEALIAAHERSGEFLDAPAYEIARRKFADESAALGVGETVSHYKILGMLGTGGMGQVYLAQDARLGRKIALKLLPSEFTQDADRVRRFEQEARAASALSHPNVCVIHEISETQDGHRYIAMEYIEGITLRQRIAQKRLKLSESLDVATQIAAGLAVAHTAGIVHRDIKPENVMLRTDGLVKVLDFGLAKLTEGQTIQTDTEGLVQSLVQTGSGVIMGTVTYMSPEQARGLAVDARTDIWSLGIVLYEMVAGQPPFFGATPSDMLVSILEREPQPVSRKSDKVPGELERILRKALKKDREERYQVVKDMALDMKSLLQELKSEASLEHAVMTVASSGETKIAIGTGQTAVVTDEKLSAPTEEVSRVHPASVEYLFSKTKRHRRSALLVLATLIIAVTGIVSWYKLSSQKQAAPMSAKLFQLTKVTKLTTNGNSSGAAISADGRYVAYAMLEGNKASLWVRQVATAGNVQIVKPAEVRYLGLTFSPDGDYVYYVVKDANNVTTLYKVPALGQGAAATRILEDIHGPVSFSPGGKQIAFLRVDPMQKESDLMIANADGSGKQKLVTRKFPENFGSSLGVVGPAWSPDGRLLACSILTTDAQGSYSNVVVIDKADQRQKLLSIHRWNVVLDTAWLSDGSGIMMNAKEQDESFLQLWLLAYPGGEARRVTSDLGDYYGLEITADSRALVSEQHQTLSNIWIAPHGDSSRAAQLTSGAGRYFDLCWAPDGKILYASDASGSADIWEMQANGEDQKQLTVNAGRNYAPVASPDGRYIVFHSNRGGGTWNIWRMDRDGSNPKQLTNERAESIFPQISPDGQMVVYTHADQIWKVPIDGGPPVQLTNRTSMRPAISPDGKLVACWQSDEKTQPTWRIAIIPFTGGSSLKLFDVPQGSVNWDTTVRWTPDGRGLTYRRLTQLQENVANIWKQPLDGAKPVQLTNFSDQIFDFAWSRDGQLLISRGVLTSDVMMITDVKQ
jgi:serine/threonine protein kinase/Tol biopolymer transport system component